MEQIEGKKITEIKTANNTHSVTGYVHGSDLIALCEDGSIYRSRHSVLQHGNRKHDWECLSESLPENVAQWEFALGGDGSSMWLLFALCEDGSVWRRDRSRPWAEIKNYPGM